MFTAFFCDRKIYHIDLYQSNCFPLTVLFTDRLTPRVWRHDNLNQLHWIWDSQYRRKICLDHLSSDCSTIFTDWRLYHSDCNCEIQCDKTEQVPSGCDAAYRSLWYFSRPILRPSDHDISDCQQMGFGRSRSLHPSVFGFVQLLCEQPPYLRFNL